MHPCSTNRQLVLCFLSSACLLGCGAEYYREDADREVYSIIEAKSAAIEGMPSHFTIEETEPFVEEETVAAATMTLSLHEAIEIAVRNSRSYQSRKESLYSQGLSLSSARHQFNPRWSGSASTELERDTDEEDSISGALSLGMRKMLATGADLSISIATNLFRYISFSDPSESAASALAASLTQPLLQGAGKRIALENLTQAERDMVYAIRDFVRYRRQFSVNIAKSYYNLLQQGDQLVNARNNYLRVRLNRERQEAMAQAGRVAEFEVDQARQDEFSARDRRVRAEQSYKNSLDEFKITLGLPTDINLEPDPQELSRLHDYEFAPPEFSSQETITIALDNRLDLKTRQDRLEDAERKVEVAANALQPGLDLFLSYRRDTGGDRQVLNFSGGDDTTSAGLDLDLPLDRKSQRNSYRQALIHRAAVRRDLEESQDRIKQDVRNAMRDLDQAQQSYEIQKMSLSLAERRVESMALLQQAGRVSTRDVLESERALLEAQNALSRALVDFYHARLDLLLATETLKIDDRGLWGEEYEYQQQQS